MFAIAFPKPQSLAVFTLLHAPRKNTFLFRRFDSSLRACRLGIAFGGKAR